MSMNPTTPPKDDKSVMDTLPPSGITVARVTPLQNDDGGLSGKLKKLKWGGIALLVILVVLDLVLSGKAYVGVDKVFGFWAWFSFAACISLVVLAKLIGSVLIRKDDYYDE